MFVSDAKYLKNSETLIRLAVTEFHANAAVPFRGTTS